MTRIAFLKSHRTWEDYLGIFLGILIVMTPFFIAGATRGHVWHNSFLEFIIGRPINHALMLNALVVGLVVFIFATFELTHRNRWEEVGQVLAGIWLMASPFVLSYAATGQLRWWHFFLGALVALLGFYEFWQDWRLSDEELARYER
ncbi:MULTISPECIES: SPW repeat protein [unclassified Bradyrhizobium]|uniref:SPW repeat protein n=1 Tax=unclassified Bradyrhizobium TaxID=2631580 RepID=UPI00070B43EE|nr:MULTISPECIES: SPW repeat protein [unclassified Bradyrhizobium]KQT22768.1 hypothetical protein ASG57_26175 [Bradyrhizobium sp. Leaf396]